MLLRLVWIGCLIVVGAASTLWFLNQRTHYTEAPTTATTNTPSVSFNGIQMIINSAEGAPQYKLSSPKYWLYHDEKRSEFELPDITIYRNNGSKIFAKALKGQTHDDNEVITLIGNVRIYQPKSGSEPHLLQIMTEKLTILPKQQRATTDSPVTAIRGPQMVTALGMTLDIDTQVLHLHSNVEGRYDP